MIEIIFNAFAPVFAVIAIGYAVRASGWVARDFWEGVIVLNHRVLLPSYLFAVIAPADLSDPIALKLGFASILLTACLAIIAFFLSRVMALAAGSAAVLCATAGQWNIISTFTLTERLAGHDALVYSAIILVPGLLLATSITVGSFALASHAKGKEAVKRVITDPLIMAGIAALIVNPILPDSLHGLVIPIELIGMGSVTAVLLAMGAGLDFAALKGKLVLLFAGAGLRTLGGTAIALGLVTVFGLTGAPAIAFMITGAAPIAALVFAIAADFKQEAELTTAMVTLSVVISCIMTPIAAAIALSL